MLSCASSSRRWFKIKTKKNQTLTSICFRTTKSRRWNVKKSDFKSSKKRSTTLIYFSSSSICFFYIYSKVLDFSRRRLFLLNLYRVPSSSYIRYTCIVFWVKNVKNILLSSVRTLLLFAPTGVLSIVSDRPRAHCAALSVCRPIPWLAACKNFQI